MSTINDVLNSEYIDRSFGLDHFSDVGSWEGKAWRAAGYVPGLSLITGLFMIVASGLVFMDAKAPNTSDVRRAKERAGKANDDFPNRDTHAESIGFFVRGALEVAQLGPILLVIDVAVTAGRYFTKSTAD